MNNPLTPSLALLCKLGSIVVHAEELISPNGHIVDRGAIEGLLSDVDVQAWIADMGPMLPVKR